ncbi:MAG: exosome complex protein Rrp4 [Methanobacteriaceae archaeon]|nr:exosome complex protein Rrp4 [Methanobacteriaceae archaeon]
MMYVNNKQMVLPGDLLCTSDFKSGDGTFLEEDKIYSEIVGITNFNENQITIIPFKNKYQPHYGDLVIGQITSINYSSWYLNINSTYSGYLTCSELFGKETQNLKNIINVDDILLLRVDYVDEINRVKLTLKYKGLGKFNQGHIINIKQPTVYFLTEENLSLTNMIQNYSNTDLIIGKNGVVWINGSSEDSENAIIDLINFIDEKPCTPSRVNKIQEKIIELTKE